MKRLMLLGLCFSAAAAMATAEVRALYRIILRDGNVVLSRDLPRQNGSVTTFHADRSGELTGLPSEQVARVETTVTPASSLGARVASGGYGDQANHPLQPGEVLVLGPIGDGATGASLASQVGGGNAGGSGGGSGTSATGANGTNGMYANGANGMYANGANVGNATGANVGNAGNFVNGNGTFSNGTPNGTSGIDQRLLGGGAGLLPNGQPSNQPLPGDVLRAQSGNVPTMSIDTPSQTSTTGFPTNAASQTTTLNPNGTPNATTTGPVAGSTQPIGPNGFPGTPQNVVGPNGFPTTAGTANTAPQNGVGPNGFTGTNGTTQQNVTNPNGFPATGAPGTTGATGTTGTTTGAGAVIVAPNGTITNASPNGGTRTNSGATGAQHQGIQQQGTQPQGTQPQGTQQRSGTSNAPNGAAAPQGGSAPSGGSGASGSSGPGH